MIYRLLACFNSRLKYSYKAFVPVALLAASITASQAQPTSTTDRSRLRVLAYQYLQEAKIGEAEAAFQKAIQVNPRELANYSDLSLLYLKEGKYREAEAEAKAGLRLSPNNLAIRTVLAKVYIQKNDKAAATQQLKAILSKDARNVYAYYALANFNASGNSNSKKNSLIRLLSFSPTNIIFRLQLAQIYTQNSKADSALMYLQSVKKIAPDFSSSAASAYNQAAAALHGNRFASASTAIQDFHNLMKPTVIYSRSYNAIEGPTLPAGYPDFVTSQIQNKGQGNRKVTLRDISFADISKNVGLDISKPGKPAHSVIAVTDYNYSEEMFLYTSNSSGGNTDAHLLTSGIGAFREAAVNGGIRHEGEDVDAAFTDIDNDGFQDLFVLTNKRVILYKNNGDGTFSVPKQDIGLRNAGNGNKMLIADFDQDGDLDLYVAGKGSNKFFRNNGDGTFKEQAAYMSLTADATGTNGMDFGDWDSDGDLDIVTVNKRSGLQLFSNKRHSKFENISGAVGLKKSKYPGTAVSIADYNNDGLQDIFVAGEGTRAYLLKNVGGHHFVVDPASKGISASLAALNVHDVSFVDFDNDGYLDLLVAATSNSPSARGVQLFHNNAGRGFTNASSLLPATVTQAYHIGLADFNTDGDDDIFLSGPNGAQLLRNDGGNLNQYLQLQLTGLSYGNSKNNRLGIGALVELKAGDLYQMRTIKRSLLNLGVGQRNKLDAVRIIWPNGTPQTIVDPSKNERIVEKELLKGSCPFLFTWNGKNYEFIKDMLWRSALGMPLAIKGQDTTYSFWNASTEYLLIPGEKLQPRNGRYSLKITEELWEAVYFDEVKLIAVDHPDSVDVYADERFVPPPFPGKQVYQVADKHLPVSAKDEDGNNLLPKVSKYDFQYANDFSLGKYQGLAEDHDLILDLGNKASTDSVVLFLRGWIFPSDASVNTAVTQTTAYPLHPPCVQVINKQGEWETVIPNLGFPMGRDKMVIANLSGKFLTENDRRVRIRTNMQIYWDHIFFSATNPKAPVVMNDVKMETAQFGYRGYSAAAYRKGGPYGPEWFDYDKVTTGQKWRDLTGNYTRHGDVLPLLQKADDEYIIADGGDEIAIDFDGRSLPSLPKGWKRDFLIYSDGWVKDGDLNTAAGQTVLPLPFHSMPTYPYGNTIHFPSDKEHQLYQQQYNTRRVTTDDFKNALKANKQKGQSKQSATK